MRSVDTKTSHSNATHDEKANLMKSLITTLTLVFAATVAQAQDFSNVTSGMLLGIYSQPTNGGMRVTSLIPGYSAQGRLFPGDVLMRATVDGYNIYNTRTHYEMENAKRSIGANRDAAIEIYRPGQGYVYVWVQFTPLYGPAAAGSPMARSTNTTKTYGAQFKTEAERPGARALFQRGQSGGGSPAGGRPTIRLQQQSPGNGAARLFGR